MSDAVNAKNPLSNMETSFYLNVVAVVACKDNISLERSFWGAVTVRYATAGAHTGARNRKLLFIN